MKKYRELIKEIHGTWLKPMPFSCSMVIIFLVQLCIANKWIDNSIGKYSGFGILVGLLIAAVGIDWIGNTRIFDFKKIDEITPLDTFLYGIVLTTFINFGCFCLHKSIVPPTIVSLFIFILVVTGLVLFIRLNQICVAQNKTNNLQNNDSQNGLLDLRDLNKGPVKWQDGDGAIVVDERAVDYDLFDRTTTQNQLRDAINHFSAKHSYVVGLVGKWGSGKTTLLTKLKEQYKGDEDTVFVRTSNNKDDFDLWLFGSQEEMIRGMYDTFLNSMGVRYNSLKNDKILESISKVVAGIPKTGSILGPLISNDSYHDVTMLKDKMSKYLKSTHKHYIMCIENLDRTSKDQVVLLLKLINSVFDFPNVTYVLLYDGSRLDRILSDTNNINKTYKEKVINQEINMPLMINPAVSKQCLKNLLKSYDFSGTDEFDVILSTIVQNLSSIRELKRIMNSVFSIFAIKDDIRLNYSQVLAIQYLFHKNLQLYNTIRENRDLLVVKKEQEFNTIDKNTSDQLKEIFSAYPTYQNLLGSLFPKIELANSSDRIIRSYHRSEEEMQLKSICMSQYFDNYFMLAENDYVRVINLLQDFNHKLNESTIDNIENIWTVFILNHTEDIKSQIINQLNLFINRGELPSSKKREKLSEIILESFLSKNEWSDNDEYSITKCIGILIGEVSEEDFNKFRQFVSKKYYSELACLELISSYMNGEGSLGGITNEFQQNSKRMQTLYNDMQEKLYKELDIDKLIKDKGNEAIDIIGRCISSRTVYDIMRDATVKRKGRTVSDIFSEIFKVYKLQVDNALTERQPRNDDEKALYDVYKKIEANFIVDSSLKFEEISNQE